MNPMSVDLSSGASRVGSGVRAVRAPRADGPGSFAGVLDAHSRPEPRATTSDAPAALEAPDRHSLEDDSAARWRPSKPTSRQNNGPEELSEGARAEREAPAEETVTDEVTEATPSEPTAEAEPSDSEVDVESTPTLDVEAAPSRAAEAKGEAALAVVDPGVELDPASSTARAGQDVTTKAKVETLDAVQWERVADADPGEDVESDTSESSEAETPKLELEAADVEVEAPASAAKAEPLVSPIEGPRAVSGYDAVGRGVRIASAEAPTPTWDVEVVEQLRMQETLQKLDDGRLRLQVNDGGERVTLTLQELDGALHLSARTATRATAEAMVQRVQELRAALADLGLVLGNLDAQADPHASSQGDEASEPDSETAGPKAAAQAGAGAPLLVRRHRIIA